MSIGERIAELRREKKLSQGQLAKIAGVSRQAVSKWENDLSAPDSLKMIRLADILDTDIEYLASGRRTYGMRPPVVIKSVETVEKIVEKPVEKIIEKTVEVPVEKRIVEYVEKPVVKKVYRTKYRRDTLEYIILGVACLLTGFLLGKIF